LTYKNLKTNETVTLPPFKVPNAHRSIAAEPSAVEARHFAAAYTLFRISSMKNTHMMLPPKYKDLWKGIFTDIKKEEIAEGKAWMYEADPFATAKAREDEEKARAKKREEDARLKAKAQEAGKKNNVISGPGSKAWERAPRVEMGKRVRLDVEALIRESTVWNSNGIEITPNQKEQIIDEITKLGFRKSHVQEAVDLCKDQKEVLEWLLIHVPEDDLPSWSLPENYIAGVSMASSDLKREAMIKRLAATGYALDLCEEELDAHTGDERCAASALQTRLLYGAEEHNGLETLDSSKTMSDTSHDQVEWDEEQSVLTSIYGERYTSKSSGTIQIVLQPESIKNITITLQLQKPLHSYPHELPIISIQANLPAYIRLSITKKALLHAKSSLLGEAMIFNLVDWLEQNIAVTIENPGHLSAVSSASAAGEVRPSKPGSRRQKRLMPSPINWTPGSQKSQDLLASWRAKRSSESQKTILTKRRSLPAWQMQVSIMQAVSDNLVTIITGETGSGKSTQAVQFILDDLIQRNLGAVANIICTQPRRISALGLADRVAEERGGVVGEEVGYIIRGDTKIRKGVTKLTFVTTGVLLRRLQTSGGAEKDIDAALADVSHVFVDEVHERGVDADFLLVLLKSVLRRRKDLRVILMSATVDAEGFVNYFSEVGTVGRVHVEGRTFPVTDFYKDDVIRMTGYRGKDDDEPEEEMDDKAVSTALRASGMKVDYNLIAKTVEHIDRELGDEEGGILIFLPGTMEIDRTLQVSRLLIQIRTIFILFTGSGSVFPSSCITSSRFSTSRTAKTSFPVSSKGYAESNCRHKCCRNLDYYSRHCRGN
jgi:ATP-dependent RNA helicase DHX57